MGRNGWDELDNRRCKWCRRLCRYFGSNGDHLCMRCQMWLHRNRVCQIKHALCSNSSMPPALCNPGLWAQMLNTLCGSIWEIDDSVQQRIWKHILCGPAPNGQSSSESEPDTVLDYIAWTGQKEYPPECSKLWKFWMLEMWGRSRNLVPRYNDSYRYERVLFIVIAFLGPFSEFMIGHGSSWTRGWIFHAVRPVVTRHPINAAAATRVALAPVLAEPPPLEDIVLYAV